MMRDTAVGAPGERGKEITKAMLVQLESTWNEEENVWKGASGEIWKGASGEKGTGGTGLEVGKGQKGQKSELRGKGTGKKRN